MSPVATKSSVLCLLVRSSIVGAGSLLSGTSTWLTRSPTPWSEPLRKFAAATTVLEVNSSATHAAVASRTEAPAPRQALSSFGGEPWYCQYASNPQKPTATAAAARMNHALLLS